MPTAKKGYYLASGERVPSVTTVLSRFKDAGGLIHWAWALGKEGKDYREERDKAADAGTMAHAAVEAWIHGQPVSFEGDPEVCAKARTAFGAFLEWARQTHLQVTHTEVPLVSEKYKFGGTFDALLIQGKRSMGDWKSSNNCYPEYLVQVAAYGKLWEENNPEQPIEGGYHLLRFDKTYGDFHHHWWGELDRAWDAFLHLRALYEIQKELTKRAA
ncbi:MAG TPA: PD-(D/E)XK nuclease family protein [Candidatus Paceibacterota bacterium]|nr:PD-(D/E)XK nuclease family protein [Candidatus Paceibacterota bacterium]